MTMTVICQKCGVSGFKEWLVYCKSCQTSAEHRYCLDETPKLKETEVNWLCEQCDERAPKVDTFDNISVGGGRKQWAMRHRRCQDRRIKNRDLQSTSIVGTSQHVDKLQNDTTHYMVKDVLNAVLTTEGLKSSNTEQGNMLPTSRKDTVHSHRENCEHLGSEVGEARRLNKRRKLILDDDSDDDAPCLVPVDNFKNDAPHRGSSQVNKQSSPLLPLQNCGSGTAKSDASLLGAAAERFANLPVGPIIHPVWRGYFKICDREYCPVVAHLSNRACEKVRNVVEVLPKVICFERLPRIDAWPKSFNCSAPAGDNIALYFFPGDVRAKAALGQLLDDVMKHDLALKVVVDKAELLVFSSLLLTQRYHVFGGGYYLWGVFRARQALRPRVPFSHCPRLTDAAGPVEEYQHCHVLKNVPADHCSRVNGSVEIKNENVFCRSQVPSCRVSNNRFSRFHDVVKEPIGEDEGPLLKRKTLRSCLLPDRFSGATEVADTPFLENFGNNVEFNCEEHERNMDGSLTACLELFPLEVEDLGIVTKMQESDKVDLELCL